MTMKTRTTKSYSELMTIPSFEDRIEYLFLGGKVGDFTFNGHRELNQALYQSPEWKSLRNLVAMRDNGYDLGHEDYIIVGSIYIHHINPITIDDLLNHKSCVYDPENLISCSRKTHTQIHYGLQKKEPEIVTRRTMYDTCPWR